MITVYYKYWNLVLISFI